MANYERNASMVMSTFPIFYYVGLLPRPLCKLVLFLIFVKKVIRDMKRTEHITTPQFLLSVSVGGIYEAMMFPILWFMEYLPDQARYILAGCLFMKLIGDVWAYQKKQRRR
ncbi:uncharacterized protein LOC123315850 isoform X1 [Coccinella septempunctata]|uniref:uncharacterized protein LOC123315850 isoform X1 n=1 Tax=Coccinella septempunctata TaxID=41139 RepID=UPI001D089571|nr:uncharacterized protein LOC123315850 isoform X1 [Coccinella septempunctata]